MPMNSTVGRGEVIGVPAAFLRRILVNLPSVVTSLETSDTGYYSQEIVEIIVNFGRNSFGSGCCAETPL